MKKSTILAATLVAMLTLSGCSSEDIGNANGNSEVGTPVTLADIGIASGTPAGRYAIDAGPIGDATTVNPWEDGDQVIVTATGIDSDLAESIANTYTYATGTWTQDAVADGATPITLDNEDYTRTYLAVETVNAITGIYSYGGKTSDVANYATGTDALDKDTYKQSDYLAYTETITVTAEDPSISATLNHQRADFWFKVYDTKAAQLPTDAALSLTVDESTYFAWNSGKVTDDNYTLFRAILPSGSSVTKATLYADGNTSGDGITITLSGSTASLAAGTRYTATVHYADYAKLNAAVTITGWDEEDMGELGTGEAIIDPGYTYDNTTNAFNVYAANGLVAVADLVNGNGTAIGDTDTEDFTYTAADITLANSIDMTGVTGFEPIGKNYTYAYTGDFDGGGNTITGLTVDITSDNAGLIGYVGSGGSVKNVKLANVSITSSKDHVGGIVGSNFGGSVTNCHVDGGSVKGNAGVGGIAGRNNNSGIIGGSNTGDACTVSNITVTAEKENAGGIVGYNYATVTGCTVSGTTGITGGNDNSTGVIIGSNDGTVSDNTVESNAVKVNGNDVDSATGNVIINYTYDDDNNAFTVYTANGLVAVADLVNGNGTAIGDTGDKGNYIAAAITLANDITMTGKDYTPIGKNTSYRYTGAFNGGGHKITGLKIDLTTSDNVGLIGFLSGSGSVTDVTLTEPNITGKNYVGAIVGQNYDGEVTKCHVSGGTISGAGGIGGIVGNNTSCTVGGNSSDGCTVTNVSITANGDNAGGIVGITSYGCTVSYNTVGGNTSIVGSNKIGTFYGLNSPNSASMYGNVSNNKVEGDGVTVTIGNTTTIVAAGTYASGNPGD